MKDDFVYLLEWYAQHIFPTISYDEGDMEESERDLIKNLQSRGEEYLLKLIDNMRYDELEDGRKILLAISYFVENAQGGVFHPRARNDLFVVGYRFVNSVLEDDPLRQAAARYRAMGEPTHKAFAHALRETLHRLRHLQKVEDVQRRSY